jgi:DUF4097 and DUF4098 domain-containing protein YvlB
LTPKVQIEDADSTVTVGVSDDGRIHVSDDTHYGGAMFSKNPPPQLQVERTADGVHIFRNSSGNTWFSLSGWSDRRIAVAVPAGTVLEISDCAGADVTGLSGAVRVHSSDGDITARDLKADADLSSDDGGIDVANVTASRLTVSSSDGALTLRDLALDSLDGSTSDGSITATGLKIANGSLKTSDGSVELSFANTNLSVHAHTDDGSISFDGRKAESTDDGDSSSGDYHIGAGGGSLQVATQDGSIHMTTNGAQ